MPISPGARSPSWRAFAPPARHRRGRSSRPASRGSRRSTTGLHAFVDVYGDAAIAAGKAADLERSAKIPRGPLHGLPIALKDLMTSKTPNHGRLEELARAHCDCTATAVERLCAAGMIPLGKTHMVEFAFGGWGRNEPMGAPWNPWDLATHPRCRRLEQRILRGVAAGLAPAALARTPAARSGSGRALRTDWSQDDLRPRKPCRRRAAVEHARLPRPLAHTAEDLALLTAAMAGPDPRDPVTLATPPFDWPPRWQTSPACAGMRITVLPVEAFPAIICADVLAAREAMIARARRSRRAGRRRARAARLRRGDATQRPHHRGEAYAVHRAYIEDAALPIDPWVRQRTLTGKAIGAADYIDEIALRSAPRRRSPRG